MKEVTKAIADQKVSGRRMVIEEVEGSEDEDGESAPAADSEQVLTSNVESSGNHAQDLANTTDANSTQELLTDETKEQDSHPSVCGGGDADSSVTEASSQPRSISAEGDTASSDDNLPPAVLALKDAGNELFRKGQYGDALDKYNAAIQLLGQYHGFLLFRWNFINFLY